MARKIISAMLLAAVAIWAEVTLAPLLSVHTHAQMAAAEHANHQPAEVPAHPCCPKAHGSPITAPPYAITSAAMPCADEHRCCFRQGPQSAPTPASNANQISKKLVTVSWATVTPNSVPRSVRDFESSAVLRSPPGDLNMVFRL